MLDGVFLSSERTPHAVNSDNDEEFTTIGTGASPTVAEEKNEEVADQEEKAAEREEKVVEDRRSTSPF